jgi:hypothetical protein
VVTALEADLLLTDRGTVADVFEVVGVEDELASFGVDVVVAVVAEPADAADEVAVPAWLSTARNAVMAMSADALRPPATFRALAAGCRLGRRRESMAISKEAQPRLRRRGTCEFAGSRDASAESAHAKKGP